MDYLTAKKVLGRVEAHLWPVQGARCGAIGNLQRICFSPVFFPPNWSKLTVIAPVYIPG